jgi:hypothetical protein
VLPFALLASTKKGIGHLHAGLSALYIVQEKVGGALLIAPFKMIVGGWEMNQEFLSRSCCRGISVPIVSVVVLVAATVAWLPSARAQKADDAAQILKSMSDYVASQKNISLTYDSDIEVITSDLEKIQFTSSGKVLLSRPDKVRASRTGGYADFEIVFDGKTVSGLGKNVNAYAQLESPGSIDQLVAKLRGMNLLTAPGADLLGSHIFDDLMADVIVAKHIGQGVIDGVECEHLAFRDLDVDWQIWVEVGARPIPRKYVITSKGVGAAPQYTLRIKEWKTDTPISADAFTFTPPQGAKKVALDELGNIDEVPQGVVTGAKK